MGWLEPLAIADVGPFVAFSWYANLCIGLTWILVVAGARRSAVILGLVGGLLGLSFLLGNSVMVAESGSTYRVTGYAAGYWLWLGSLCLALLSATLLPKSEVSVQSGSLPIRRER